MSNFIIKNCHKSWKNFIERKDIQEELDKIYDAIGDNYYPNNENVLRFLSNDLNNLKCIIVGMEPYPTSFERDGKQIPIATGRSFEVELLRGQDWNYKIKQSSLRNILKTIYFNETNEIISLEEIRKKINSKEFKILEPTDWFDSLENQGVMFLNATLTVQKEKVDTHTKLWKYFMDELIKYIEENNKNVKWFLWGDKARQRVFPLIDENKAIICMHPRLASFVKENPFKEVKNVNWLG